MNNFRKNRGFHSGNPPLKTEKKYGKIKMIYYIVLFVWLSATA